MALKKIPQIEPKGATKLTPMEMNKIPFDTGHHSDLPVTDNKISGTGK